MSRTLSTAKPKNHTGELFLKRQPVYRKNTEVKCRTKLDLRNETIALDFQVKYFKL